MTPEMLTILKLTGKFFIPNWEEVKVELRVGALLNDNPVSISPIDNKVTLEPMMEKRVTTVALVVTIFAIKRVFLRPRLSKIRPKNTRPSPLDTATTPTNKLDNTTVAPTNKLKSFAKLKTACPIAVTAIMYKK